MNNPRYHSYISSVIQWKDKVIGAFRFAASFQSDNWTGVTFFIGYGQNPGLFLALVNLKTLIYIHETITRYYRFSRYRLLRKT